MKTYSKTPPKASTPEVRNGASTRLSVTRSKKSAKAFETSSHPRHRKEHRDTVGLSRGPASIAVYSGA